jgi:hypothetical protein
MISILALTAAVMFQVPTGAVTGRVHSEPEGSPLGGAVIEIRAGEDTRRAVTDSLGGYAFERLPAGSWAVEATRLGFAPLAVEIMVPRNGDLVVDFWLRVSPIPLQGLLARGATDAPPTDTAAISPPAAQLALARTVDITTGIAELGLGDPSSRPPGLTPPDPSDVLFVRGAAADLKLVLLDGAPVYTPFHVGGLVAPFDAGLLSGATLHLGGAPARYDGGLSYILDLSTRGGRSGPVRTSGAVDMLAARTAVEGSLGTEVSYLVGGRAVHGWGVQAWSAPDLPYRYSEGLARVDVRLGAERSLSATAFRNGEAVDLPTIADPDGRADWGNSALSLRYFGRLAGADAEITASYGSFNAALPVTGANTRATSGSTERGRVAVDFRRPVGGVSLRYGASFDRIGLDHEVLTRPVEGPPVAWRGGARGESSGAYLEAAWQPATRLRVRGGLRGDVFFLDPTPRLAPRLAVTWMLTERAALTAAAGKYHQYVRRLAAARSAQDASPDTFFIPVGFTVGGASHLNLSLDQQFDPALRLGIEGYFKTFDGIAPWPSDRSHASGVDLWLRAGGAPLAGWLGYSLSWVWTPTSGGAATESFAGRHVLNAGMSGLLADIAAFDVKVAYGAGLPFAALNLNSNSPDRAGDVATLGNAPESSAMPPTPSDPYLRLDVGISRTFRPGWGSGTAEISPYLRVLNSLDRRDALFYRYDSGSGAPRPIAALPLIPVLGLEWKF